MTEIATWDSWIRQDSCFDQRDRNLRCSLLQIDLNRDGQPEMILWKTRYDIQPKVYARKGAAWNRVGYLTYSKAPTTAIDIQIQLMTEGLTSKPSTWNELSVGTIRYQVLEDEAAR